MYVMPPDLYRNLRMNANSAPSLRRGGRVEVRRGDDDDDDGDDGDGDGSSE